MSESEIEDLVYLDRSRFDEREHVALSWVRATVTSREGASPELAVDFLAQFDARERRCIVAAMQGMFFTNLVTNTLFGKVLQPPAQHGEQPAACDLAH